MLTCFGSGDNLADLVSSNRKERKEYVVCKFVIATSKGQLLTISPLATAPVIVFISTHAQVKWQNRRNHNQGTNVPRSP